MKRLFFLLLPVALLTGCASTESFLYSANLWPVNPNTPSKEHLRAIERGDHGSLLRVYEIREAEDSAYVSMDAMQKVAEMITCPPLENTAGFGPYNAEPILDTKSMSLRVKINRPNCYGDLNQIRDYMDERIAKAKILRKAVALKEKEARESDPRGPYFMGCTDYQKFVKGESGSNKGNASEAIKRYPQLHADYVSRLYFTGWEDAKAYGVRSVSCVQLTQINIGY